MSDATVLPSRFDCMAEVRARRRIVENEYQITLYAPEIAQAARPGQFLEILTGENGSPLIRRPFSIFSASPQQGLLQIVYLARGSFTSGLARLKKGDSLSLLGPLGTGFRYHPQNRCRHILIAGGIGAPPLHFLAQSMRQQGMEHPLMVLNGARTRSMLVGMKEFAALKVALHPLTEDGSMGRKGRVTELLKELLLEHNDLPAHIYACGPMPMLRSIGELSLHHNAPCQLSVETSMPCGTGVCYGCAIPIHSPLHENGFRYARACTEGPVFEANELIWP